MTCLLLQLVLGCSTADGLDTGYGDETASSPDPPEPTPASEGSSCGEEVFGWRTACEVYGQISYQNPLEPSEYLEIDPFVGPTFACCEGNPDPSTADSACEQSCRQQLCDIAQNIYDQIAQENGWVCGFGCDFDLAGCMAGMPVQQFPQPPFGEDHPHEVTVACEATNIQARHPDGTFEFIESPVDIPYGWDPAVCGPSTQGAVFLPLGSLVANIAREDAGTHAFASWWSGVGQDEQGTVDVEAELAYAVRPCGDAECLELTRLDVQVPPGLHAGLAVQSARLTLIGVAEPPVIDRAGTFSFPAGSLQFLLTAAVGGLPLALTRTNAAAVRGRLSHSADVFELADLHVAHEESGFGAELRLDLAASHTNRVPQTTIRRLDNPIDCNEPVVLQAASVDPDDDPMQHYWWTPTGMVRAPTVELVLARGTHFVVLVSVDDHGAHDATSLTFKRSCS